MNVGTRFNTLACLTVAMGLVTFCLADSRPMLALTAMAVCVVGWLTGRGDLGWRPVTLPRILVNLLVLAAIINAAFRASSATPGQPIVSHLGEFLVFVQVLKLFDRRTTRDESQLLTLSVFVIIAAMLTSNTLAVGVCLVVYTPLAISAALMFQLRSGLRRGLTEPTTEPPAVFAGGRASRHLRSVAAMSVASAAAIAAIVFVLTPRGLGMGALGRFGEARVTQTGFSEQIKLGQSGFLQDSTVPVLDFAVEDSSGVNLGSNDRVYYLRGVTRDRYQQNIWTSSAPTPAQERAYPGASELRKADAGAPTLVDPALGQETTRAGRTVQRITLRSAGGEQVLFGVWRPISVTANQPISLVIDPRDLSVRRRGPAVTELTYVVQSSPADNSARTEGTRRPRTPQTFSRGPIHDLAVSILDRAQVAVDPDARDRAANRQAAGAFRDYLQLGYEYSRELTKPEPGQDPLQMFLFDTKRGHCEYFASAMVAMCQAAGLPARLVVGYVAADYNSLTGKYIVRQSNAHAWVEYHVGEGAWQTIDPSPPGDVAALRSNGRGWLAAVRNWYDSIEFGWNRSIVGYDATSQQRSTVGRRLNFDGLVKRFDDLTGQLFVSGKKFREVGGVAAVSTWLLPALAILAVAFVVARRWIFRGKRTTGLRRGAFGHSSAGAHAARTPFYARALKVLGRAGIAKPDALPPLAYADRLARAPSPHPASKPLAALAGLYYQIRFAGRRLSVDEQAEADRSLESLRNAVKGYRP